MVRVLGREPALILASKEVVMAFRRRGRGRARRSFRGRSRVRRRGGRGRRRVLVIGQRL